MGTKLEYAVNPLASSVNSNSFTLHGVDDWDSFQNIGLNQKQNKERITRCKFQSSMDRLLEKHNIESIKKTMQMHEAIFRQQVQELHRLYNVQKMLMDELDKDVKKCKSSHSPSGSHVYSHNVQQQHQAAETTFGYNFYVQNLRDDQSTTREWSAVSSDHNNLRLPKAFELERPAEVDISARVSAITENQAAGSSSLKSLKMDVDGSDEDSEVDLTLSIGGSKNKKKSKCHKPIHSQELSFCGPSHEGIRKVDSSASPKSDQQGDECREPTATMSSSSSATFDQERNRPQWLFQGLSLNRT